ncbi:GNAT family N-acetyltransferase [Paenibacillus faecis]|uniref:GNAT family N-acetyltransferase n=1 Tax=Paenibacillus faecis TaxID=862114 RepID=A0A5D0CM42_9BACL|nr:GNAT family N-acetyltransferase [Paenibacillus faecis]TYA10254.1 GNAT family N-acetyltransferase [Paenibacillus faecis]
MIVRLSLQNPDTVEQLWSLQHAAYRLEAEAMGLRDVPPLPETFESIRNSDEDFYGVLSADGELLGAIVTAPADTAANTLEITRLMIHPDHLRKGIGASLLKHVIDHHPEIRTFAVTAGTHNEPAVSLYRKFGFMPGESVKSIPGAGLTVFRFHRT